MSWKIKMLKEVCYSQLKYESQSNERKEAFY